jgi:hypothetical protein
MSLIKYEKNSYGYIFKRLSNASFEMESSENNSEFNAWKLVNGEPPLNTSLDMFSPISIGDKPPIISE